jgi:hypothetical protein
VGALVTAIARGGLVPNIQAFDLRWYNVLTVGRIIHCRIMIRCRPEPEEVRSVQVITATAWGFWMILGH